MNRLIKENNINFGAYIKSRQTWGKTGFGESKQRKKVYNEEKLKKDSF